MDRISEAAERLGHNGVLRAGTMYLLIRRYLIRTAVPSCQGLGVQRMSLLDLITLPRNTSERANPNIDHSHDFRPGIVSPWFPFAPEPSHQPQSDP